MCDVAQTYTNVHICDVAHNQRFIYSVFTKDTLDEKGQAGDTGVHVTPECF